MHDRVTVDAEPLAGLHPDVAPFPVSSLPEDPHDLSGGNELLRIRKHFVACRHPGPVDLAHTVFDMVDAKQRAVFHAIRSLSGSWPDRPALMRVLTPSSRMIHRLGRSPALVTSGVFTSPIRMSRR